MQPEDRRVSNDQVVNAVELVGHSVWRGGFLEGHVDEFPEQRREGIAEPVVETRRTLCPVGKGQVGASEILDGPVIPDGEPEDERPNQGGDIELAVPNDYVLATGPGFEPVGRKELSQPLFKSG